VNKTTIRISTSEFTQKLVSLICSLPRNYANRYKLWPPYTEAKNLERLDESLYNVLATFLKAPAVHLITGAIRIFSEARGGRG
jgi:hypothetical protein